MPHQQQLPSSLGVLMRIRRKRHVKGFAKFFENVSFRNLFLIGTDWTLFCPWGELMWQKLALPLFLTGDGYMAQLWPMRQTRCPLGDIWEKFSSLIKKKKKRWRKKTRRNAEGKISLPFLCCHYLCEDILFGTAQSSAAHFPGFLLWRIILWYLTDVFHYLQTKTSHWHNYFGQKLDFAKIIGLIFMCDFIWKGI